MTILARVAAWLHARQPAPPESRNPHLIRHVDVLVQALCPCGSTIEHALTLYGTSDCVRCGRTIGVRSIEYVRQSPSHQPAIHVSVGFVVTHQSLRRARTVGVQ